MAPVKVGIIGVSFMGSAHFNIYKANPKARVVAIADVNPKRLKGDWSDIAGNIGAGAKRVDLKGIATYADGRDLITFEFAQGAGIQAASRRSGATTGATTGRGFTDWPAFRPCPRRRRTGRC